MKTLGAKAYIWGQEECPDTKKIHMQGYVEFKKETRFSTLKKHMPRTHFEAAKGNRDANIAYCTKDGCNIVRNGFPFGEEELALMRQKELWDYFKDFAWRDWQKEVLKECELDSNDRKIIWIYEETGGVGKTLLAQYIHLKYEAVLATGKKSDVFHSVIEHSRTHLHVKVALLDIPREAMEFVHFGTIEKIKDCMVKSGKYEGGTWTQSRKYAPHVICFANTPPKREKMSKDRWSVFKIVDGQLIEEKQELFKWGEENPRGGNEFFDYQ